MTSDPNMYESFVDLLNSRVDVSNSIVFLCCVFVSVLDLNSYDPEVQPPY